MPTKETAPVSVQSLDFTAPAMEQDVIKSSQLTEIPTMTSLPRSTLDSVPIEFRIPKSAAYVDLGETFLYLRIKVKFADNSDLTADGNFSTVNNLGYALWSNVDVFVSGEKLTTTSSHYPWMSYIHCLTKLSKAYQDTVLHTALWRRDQAGLMDANDVTQVGNVNSGAQQRAAKIQQSDPVEMYVRLLPDFGYLKKLLPSYTDIGISFHPAKPSLCLLAASGNLLTVQIDEAKLYVSKVFLSASAEVHYSKLLASKGFSYPTQQYHTRTHVVNQGEQNLQWTPIVGKLPRRVYVYQVQQDAFNGAIQTNPFDLKTFNMRNIQLFVNDVSTPANVPTAYGTENKAKLYMNTMHTINKSMDCGISLDDFTTGYFLLAFDLTPDRSATAEYSSQVNEGTVRLVIDYDSPPSSAIVVFCTYEEDCTLHIDKNRNVKWTH